MEKRITVGRERTKEPVRATSGEGKKEEELQGQTSATSKLVTTQWDPRVLARVIIGPAVVRVKNVSCDKILQWILPVNLMIVNQ